MKEETTFYLIKPELFKKRSVIRKYIKEKTNLRIVSWSTCIINKNDIDILFKDDTDCHDIVLIDVIKKHLVGKKVEVGLIKGVDAIKQFTVFCGTDFRKEYCAPGTIRAEFGLSKVKIYGNVPYCLNGIHRASSSEARVSIRWYKKKFKNNNADQEQSKTL